MIWTRKIYNVYCVYAHISIIFSLLDFKEYFSQSAVLHELFRLTFQFCSLSLQMDLLLNKHMDSSTS